MHLPAPQRRRPWLLVLALPVLLAGALVPSVAASAAVSNVSEESGPPASKGLTPWQRLDLYVATLRYVDPQVALADGYVATEDCVPNMGYHYVNYARLQDPTIDPTLPEVLVYAPTAVGGKRLVALEYMRRDADGDLRTTDDRPNLWGHPFDGPMAPHAGMPSDFVHYDLHVWLYRHNPDGLLTAQNPRLRCPDDGVVVSGLGTSGIGSGIDSKDIVSKGLISDDIVPVPGLGS